MQDFKKVFLPADKEIFLKLMVISPCFSAMFYNREELP